MEIHYPLMLPLWGGGGGGGLWLVSSQWRQWNPKAGGKLISSKCPCWQDLNNQSSPITIFANRLLTKHSFPLIRFFESSYRRGLNGISWPSVLIQYLTQTQTEDYCPSLRLQIRASSSHHTAASYYTLISVFLKKSCYAVLCDNHP
jgi:hypothetical protein